MAEKSIEKNKAQAIAAAYWARVAWLRYDTQGFPSYEDCDLGKANTMAADNARRARRVRQLPLIGQ